MIDFIVDLDLFGCGIAVIARRMESILTLRLEHSPAAASETTHPLPQKAGEVAQ